LIKSGHLRKFLDNAANGKVVVPKTLRNPQRDQGEKSGEEKVRIAVNTIAGGFAGGGKHRSYNASESPRPNTQKSGVNMISPLDLDPREKFQDRRVSPIEELEQVQIGEAAHKTTNLGTAL
jgi:hypothetical protein